MLKKCLLIFLVFTLFSCGYEPLYINKNDSLKKIGKIEKSGDKRINRKIITLIGFKENNTNNKPYALLLVSNKSKEIATKNSSGNVTAYKISINVKVSIIEKNNSNIIKSKEFNSTFIYNNQENKFQMSQDIRNIENNLIESASEKIIMYLNS